jgi:HEAT repeat protein
MAWQYLTEPQVLLNAARSAVRDPAPHRLREAWEWALAPVVAQFARHYYHEDPDFHGAGVSVDRLVRAVRGSVGAALAIVSAQQQDEARAAQWAHHAAAAWMGATPTEELGADGPVLQGGGARGLDEHFKRLSRLAPGLWQVGAVRECVRYLLGLEPRPTVRRRKVPLLGHKERRGLVVWLYVELVEDGAGELYSDPVRMATVPMTADFLSAVETAWFVARAQPASMQSEPALATQLGARDVRWWVEGRDLWVLDGPSLGLAMTLALTQLLRNGPLDPQCAITGAVDEGGHVLPVGWVEEKVAAAWGDRDEHGRPRITRVIVPRDNETAAHNGAAGSDKVHPVATVAEAGPIASGLLGEACRLLARQARVIDEECRRRTGRPLDDQFVPVKVARGPRPRLRPEQYGPEGPVWGPLSPADLQRPALAWEQVRGGITRAVVLGDPGFGKTMLLWHEARRRCQDQLERALTQQCGPDQLVPVVFQRAADLAQPLVERPRPALADVLLARVTAWAGLSVQTQDWLREQLRQGLFFLAIDGLEEVPLGLRKPLAEGLALFTQDHPGVKLLLSSRSMSANGAAVALPEVEQFDLLGLDDAQVKSTVGRWCGPDGRGAELLAHLRGQPLLLQALRNPLLLRLACQAAEGAARAGRALRPWRRPAELYEDFLENAVASWAERSKQRTTRLQQGHFPRFAAAVAWRLWKAGPERAVFGLEQLAAAVSGAQDVLPAFQSREDAIEDLCDAGLIVPAGADVPGAPYLFTHRTVQEYLVARTLARRNNWLETALAHTYDDGWQGVLQLLGGALDGERAAKYAAALLRKNQEDLMCRPLRLAVLVAANADDHFPAGLRIELAERMVALHVAPPPWLAPEHFLPPLLACGPAAVQPLLRRLENGNGAVCAAAALGAMQVRAAVAPLLRWLVNGVAALRAASAAALGAMQASEAVHALLDRLDDEDESVRLTAAASLGALSARSAVPHLLRRLAGKWWECEAAAAAVGALQATEAVPSLLGLLGTGDDLMREAAAGALGALQAREAVPALLVSLANGSASVRVASAKALGALRSREAVNELLCRLDDTAEPVRQAAAAALGAVRAREALAPLLGALEHPSVAVRAAAATALGAMHEREAVPFLFRRLEGEVEERRAAAAALGALQAREAVRPLLGLLDDKDEETVLAALRSLGALQAREAVPALLKLLAGPSAQVARAAVQVVASMHVREAVPALIGLLNHLYEWVRAAAATALGALGAREAGPELMRLLGDGGRLVRSAAAQALLELEGKGMAVPAQSAPATVQERLTELNGPLEALLDEAR